MENMELHRALRDPLCYLDVSVVKLSTFFGHNTTNQTLFCFRSYQIFKLQSQTKF
jgi:hypothetical protein